MLNIKKYTIADNYKKLELYAESAKDFKGIRCLIDFIKHVSLYSDVNVVPFDVFFIQKDNKIVIKSDFLFMPLSDQKYYEPISEMLNKNGMHPQIPTEISLLRKKVIITENTPLIDSTNNSDNFECIDYSDIPATDEIFWADALIHLFKKKVHNRLKLK